MLYNSFTNCMFLLFRANLSVLAWCRRIIIWSEYKPLSENILGIGWSTGYTGCHSGEYLFVWILKNIIIRKIKNIKLHGGFGYVESKERDFHLANSNCKAA